MNRLYMTVALVILAVVAAVWFVVHERHAGAAGERAKQTDTALKTSEANRRIEHSLADAYTNISSDYLRKTPDDYPSIADALPATVATGTVRLRNDCPAGDTRAADTAASRAAGEAATAALANRVQTAIDAVRIGDEADKRERDLREQVIALQAAYAKLVESQRASQPL